MTGRKSIPVVGLVKSTDRPLQLKTKYKQRFWYLNVVGEKQLCTLVYR